MIQRFWLIRHALVHPGSMQHLYGTNDVPICDETMAADAPRYAALAARLPRPARLICTPLTRTQLTAAALIRAGYPDETPLIDPAFVEQNFGAFQGQPISTFDARSTAERHPFWPIHAQETPPEGENFETMIARTGAGLERLLAAPEHDTIIVSHGGAIRAMCAYALGLTAHQALCLSVDNISLTRLEYNRHGWRILSVNEHLSTMACATPLPPSNEDISRHPKQNQGASA
ncbi:histidine phosphatase family protein [Acidocella aquatica]|nr:histidine phosphatase family protein [Acidocella aquatica]